MHDSHPSHIMITRHSNALILAGKMTSVELLADALRFFLLYTLLPNGAIAVSLEDAAIIGECVSLCPWQSTCVSVSNSVSVHLYVFLCVCLSACLCVFVSICLSVYLSIFVSVVWLFYSFQTIWSYSIFQLILFHLFFSSFILLFFLLSSFFFCFSFLL